MAESNWTIFVVAIVCLVIGGAVAYVVIPTTEVNATSESDIQKRIDQAVSDAITEKDIQIDSLNEQIANISASTSEETSTIVKNLGGYLLDDLSIETLLNEEFSDRELNLFDGEVNLDGHDYDAKETFSILPISTTEGASLKANEKDYNGDVYFSIPRKSVEYKMIFDPTLPYDEIGEDEETLKFDFLGEEVEISEWDTDSNEITLSQGEKYLLKSGDTITVLNQKVTLAAVGDDDEVIVGVDGISAVIREGKTKYE